MALINRITRLFRADMHAVLDRLEEPQALLKQSVREMDDAIQQLQQRLKQDNSEHSDIAARQQELQQTLEKISKELDLCFENDNESLARSLIKRRLEIEQYSQCLARKHEKLVKAISATKQSLHDQEQRLGSIKQKQELLMEEPSTAYQENITHPDPINISDDAVEIALIREKQQRKSS